MQAFHKLAKELKKVQEFIRLNYLLGQFYFYFYKKYKELFLFY